MNDVKSIEMIRWKNAAALIGMAQGVCIIRGTGIKASDLFFLVKHLINSLGEQKNSG